MIPMVWLTAAAILNVLVLWIISRSRGVTGSSALPVWMRVLTLLGSLVISGAITWWVFDVSGFLASQRLAAAGDYAAAAGAWKPLISLNASFYLIVPLVLLVTVGIGIHMALRPGFWASSTSGGKPVSAGTLVRFRLYGYLLAGLGLAAAIGILFALFSQTRLI